MNPLRNLAVLLLAVGLSLPTARAGDQRPIVPVFDIEDTRSGRAKLSAKKLKGLTDYLTNKLAIGGKFKIVPRSDVLSAIRSKKKESFKECYDESCQIEIGKELAAQKSLSTKISQMGDECIVTSTLYDLRQGATENSASYRGPCGRSEILTAIEQIAAQLRGDKRQKRSNKNIRFDTSGLPTVPTLDMPPDAGQTVAGVDFGDVDVTAIELYDAAVQADQDESVAPKEKISKWLVVKKKAPKFRKHATDRIVAWREHIRTKKQIEQIQKKRAAKMLKDWNKLSRLLRLKVVSDEDKQAWKEAFIASYGEEVKTNPYARKPDVDKFFEAIADGLVKSQRPGLRARVPTIASGSKKPTTRRQIDQIRS